MILEKIAEFIVAHWRIFGTIFILAGVAIYEHHEGYQEAMQFHADYIAKENVEKVKALQDNEVLKNQLEVAKNEAQTRINDYINTHPARRVLLPCTAPIETKPASGVEATTPSRESLSISVSDTQREFDDFLEQTSKLMVEADTTVNQCRVMQDYLNK